MLITDYGLTISIFDSLINFNRWKAFVHNKNGLLLVVVTWRQRIWSTTWLHEHYSATVNVIFMKLGEVKLNK